MKTKGETMRFRSSRILTVLAAAAVLFSSVDGHCLEPGPEKPRTLVYVNDTGDVVENRTRSPAKLHLQGAAVLASADYFRGRFDGVPEALGNWSLQPSFRLIVELAEQITFTAGVANGLSDEDPNSAENLDIWYEANPHFGFAGKISHMYGGLTYTVFGSPNDTFASTEEVTLDMRSTDTLLGPLFHWLKLAWRLDGGSGFFFEIGIAPEFSLQKTGSPVRISIPVSVGTGWDGYYAADDGQGFIRTGIDGTLRLDRYLPDSCGRWQLEPSLTVILRDESLAEDAADDAGDVVVVGSVSLSFLQ